MELVQIPDPGWSWCVSPQGSGFINISAGAKFYSPGSLEHSSGGSCLLPGLKPTTKIKAA